MIRLTQREKQVLEMLARGLTAAQIARRWTISERTVNTHKANVYRKLGAHNAAGAVATATRIGLIRVRLPGGGVCPRCGCTGHRPLYSEGRRAG